MTDNPSLISFPCDFPIKIIGLKTDTFKAEISKIVCKHFPQTQAEQIICKDSQKGNYLAITATVHAVDQASLDKLYQELTQHPSIKMVL